MVKREIGLIIALLFVGTFVFGQATAVFTDADRAYNEGIALMEKGVFGKAQRYFNEVINLLRPVNEEQSKTLLTKAEFNFAKCAVLLGMPDSEKLMLEFIRKYSPDPIANSAYIEVANYFFNSGKYEKAIRYYSQIPTYGMNRKDRETVKFKRDILISSSKNSRMQKMILRILPPIRKVIIIKMPIITLVSATSLMETITGLSGTSQSQRKVLGTRSISLII